MWEISRTQTSRYGRKIFIVKVPVTSEIVLEKKINQDFDLHENVIKETKKNWKKNLIFFIAKL
jgi:hypothetical protein